MRHYVKQTNFDHTIEELDRYKTYSLDTETTGLYPYHGDKLFSVIISTYNDDYYFDFNIGGLHRSWLKYLGRLFRNPNKYWFFVNAIYDLAILKVDNLEIAGTIIDAPSIARVETSNHPESFLSMDYLARFYLQKKKDDSVIKYIKEHSLYTYDVMGDKGPDYTKVPKDMIFKYGCNDGRITYDLCRTILDLIDKKDKKTETERPEHFPPMQKLIKQELKLTRTLFKMQTSGIRIDVPYTRRAYKHETILAHDLEVEVKKELGKDFNLRSPKQVATYLISQGVRLQKTPKGNFICDAEALAAIDNPVANKITKSKQAQKKANTYYANFLKLKDKHNILHCQINQNAARTGRLSSSKPNLQNLIKEIYDGSTEYLVRNSFIAAAGRKLYFFDWKQQEMHVMIDRSGEMPVIEEMKKGLDFYEATQKRIKEVARVILSRDRSKAISLGLAYGEGITLLASNLQCTHLEARKFKRAFFQGLPQVMKLKQNLEYMVKICNKIYNPFGRVTYIQGNKAYKALNAFVQGTSADIMKSALNTVSDICDNFKSDLILTVHDELIIDMVNGEERELVPLIEKAMIDAYPFKYIPLKVDISVSNSSWVKKVKYVRA